MAYSQALVLAGGIAHVPILITALKVLDSKSLQLYKSKEAAIAVQKEEEAAIAKQKVLAEKQAAKAKAEQAAKEKAAKEAASDPKPEES